MNKPKTFYFDAGKRNIPDGLTNGQRADQAAGAVIQACNIRGEHGQIVSEDSIRDLLADAPALLRALRDLYEHCAMVPVRAETDIGGMTKGLATIKAGKALIAKHTVHATTTADVEKLSAALRARGIPHSAAQYDENGKCLTCGESSEHCPGVHTFEEIQAAGRAAAAIARPPVAPCNGCLNCSNKKDPLP